MTASPSKPTTKNSIYDQIGGAAAVEAAVEIFYDRVLADSLLKPFFAKTNMDKQKRQQIAFLTTALGGPAIYKGRDMKKAHAHLPIELKHFAKVAEHLNATLESLNVPPALIEQIMETAGSLAPDIVNTTTKSKSPKSNTPMKPAIAARNRRPSNGRPASVEATPSLPFDSMLENAPINVMFADTDLRITYLNPSSVKTLRSLQKYLPISVDEIVGQSVDIFHKNPRHQQTLLSDPGNLPRSAIIDVGPEKLDLLVSPIYDESREYLGAMVTWSVITEKLKLESEVARVMSMMEQAPINVMFCDRELNITYMNSTSKKTLKTIEHLLPCKVEDALGQSVDIFHKNPAYQRKLLGDPKNLPHRATIQIEKEFLDLNVNAILDQNKQYIGAMVTWEIITNKLELERKQKELTESLKGTLESVDSNAQALSAASEELSATAQQLSSNSEETSAQANSAAAAAEQVSQNVATVATSAEEMSASTREIAKNASEAAKVASQAVKVAEDTSKTVNKLGESSAEIGNVIKVITSIAQQTNLLALNATIEAARAGEAGKGFAVVANEVKELAKQTAAATEDISQKIAAIQDDTKGAVEAITEISTIINQINGIQNTIASAVEEQTSVTNEIARSAGEAAKGSGEIASNITNVSQAARSTSEGSANTLTASAELARLASQLKQVVDAAIIK